MVAARVLAKLGETFDVNAISKSAQNILAQIPSLGVEPGPSPAAALTLPPEVVPFSAVGSINALGESSTSSSPSIDANSIVSGLVSSTKLQTATRLDSTVLKRWLERDWNVNIAVDEALAGSSPYAQSSLATPSQQPSRRPSYTPINGLGAGGAASLVNGSNASSVSVGQPGRLSIQVPSTGVNDLREALGTASPVSTRHANGYSQDGGLSPAALEDRRAHRRESRRVPAATGSGAVGILDSLKVGVDEDSSKLGPDSSLATDASARTLSPVPAQSTLLTLRNLSRLHTLSHSLCLAPHLRWVRYTLFCPFSSCRGFKSYQPVCWAFDHLALLFSRESN